MFEDKSYEAHEDHKNFYDALEKSLEREYSDQFLSDLEEARQKKKINVTYQELLLSLHCHSHHLLLLPQAHLVLQVHLSDDEDSGNDHLPKADSRKECWKPLAKEERPATPKLTEDMMNFLNWYCRQVNKTALTPANLEGQAYEVVKAFHSYVIHLQF
uniref:Uncharacterized protein n=1 Tax=Tanacetum cinerariifolium TaxID=118510 RepID=A0A699JHN2_TANCI|nr:hypothetical protein [Tanacetum cinerariifolium]